ncbi:MFS transporter [Amycolatopsis deserti]|uniref:MFS transporter n=1 Tax=Amycolatopsis deserti TaxID=185696 RepID=A0ABQ3IGM1_9PSEU|nr:DHA2 family efflux MFS transporter permease subunit [Amycolatopsis deserti]GHE83850.1 MFS transporter [Amycolatopsis deserti]
MDRSTTARAGALDREVVVTGLVVVCGLIMVVFDTTIVNVALETVSRQLGAGLSTAQWMVTGYLLAVGLVIPLTGWAMDRFGTKPVWILSVVLFAAGSALCAAAWSIESLIAFRVVQGLGGGMLLPGGQTIITRAAGPERLGRAMAILGVPMLLGPVFGPVLGGLLVEYTSWHWIFLVNVPVAVCAVGLAAWKLPGGGEVEHPGRIDVRGLVLLSGSLVVLLYGLSRASSQGGFGHWNVIAWLIAGGAGLALYTWHSLGRGPAALIDVRLFANRFFTAGAVTIFLVAVALFGGLLLLPLYYQTVRGEGALTAGLLLAPQGLGAMVAMPLAGKLTDRVGAGFVVPVGIVLALLGTAPLAQVGTATSYAWLSAVLFVRGLGLGSVMMPTFAAAYAKLDARAVSRAAPTLSAIQQVGASLGSALLVTALTQHLTGGLAARGIPAAGPGPITSMPPAARATVGPILAESFGFAFWVAFGMTAVLIFPALLLPRRAKRSSAA